MLDFKLTKKHIPTLIFFGVIMLSGFWNVLILFPLVLYIIFRICKTSSDSFYLTYLDIGFLILLLSEIITTLNSSYVYNSLSSITRLILFVFLYVFYKNVLKKENNYFLNSLLYLLSTALLILTIKFFIVFYNDLTSKGFSELNDFKNLYVPLGILNNIWASALLLLIPFNLIFLLNQDKKEDKIFIIINLLLNTFCIIVSFSRGIYFSLFAFILFLNILLIKYIKSKQLFLYNIVAFLMLSLSILLVNESFITTISLNKTESQRRSTAGRVALWKHSSKLVNDKPLFGYGQDNYLIAQDKTSFTGEDIGLTFRTNNAYIKILIERGIFGLFSFIFFFLVVTAIVYKNLKSAKINKKVKIKIVILFSGIISILIRELTFSSLFENDFIYLLTFHLIFLLIPYDIKIKEFTLSKQKRKGFIIISLILIFILIFMNSKRVLVIYNNHKFIELYTKNETQKSLKFIEKALMLSPKNSTLNKHKAIALAKGAFEIDFNAKNPNLLCISNLKNDTLNLSLKYLHRVLDNRPFDSETLHNLGWVNFVLDNNEEAKYYFNKALELSPFLSQYHISMLLYNIKNNNQKDILNHLSLALRFSPDILESKFYYEFSRKYPTLAFEAKKLAVLGLEKQLEVKPSPVLKARLARLLLDEDAIESYHLLEDVTMLLPNLNRPWLYMAYLASSSIKDTVKINKFYKNSLFLYKKDFLPKLYYARYFVEEGMDERAILLLKESMKDYKLIKSNFNGQNKALSNLETVSNSYIPNDLLYLLKPQVNASEIFNFFGNYYYKQENNELSDYYKRLSLKYKNKIYKGEEELR